MHFICRDLYTLVVLRRSTTNGRWQGIKGYKTDYKYISRTYIIPYGDFAYTTWKTYYPSE